MDTLLRPTMRALDRLKIAGGKQPTVLHAPYTRDMAHIISAQFLEDPERFYFRPEPT